MRVGLRVAGESGEVGGGWREVVDWVRKKLGLERLTSEGGLLCVTFQFQDSKLND